MSNAKSVDYARNHVREKQFIYFAHKAQHKIHKDIFF